MSAATAMNPQKRDRLLLAAWDALLCWVLAACLAVTASGAFFTGPQIAGNPLFFAGVPGAAVLLLELRALGGRWHWLGPVLAAAAAVALVLAAAAAAPGSQPLADVEDNPLPFTVLALACAFACYLLARSIPGSVVLVLGTVLLCAAIEYLYEQGRLTPAAIAFAAALGIVVLARFRKGRMQRAQGSCPPGSLAAGSCMFCAAALLLGMGGYALLSSAVELPHAEIKLITQEMALEEIEVEGITSTALVYDEDQAAQEEQPSDWLSSMLGEESSTENEQDAAQESPTGSLFQAISGLVDPEAWATTASSVRYEASPLTWLVVLLAIAAAAFAAVFGKRALRKRWLTRTCALPAAEQSREFFRFFMRRLGRLGIKRRETDTLEEFRARCAEPLRQLFSSQPELLGLFDAGCAGYCQSYYGDLEPSPASLEAWRQLYRGFYPCCIAHLGRLRYALRFFFL